MFDNVYDEFKRQVHKEPKRFKCSVIITQVTDVVLEADSPEEFEAKAKAKGYRIAPLSVPHEFKGSPFTARY